MFAYSVFLLAMFSTLAVWGALIWSMTRSVYPDRAFGGEGTSLRGRNEGEERRREGERDGESWSLHRAA